MYNKIAYAVFGTSEWVNSQLNMYAKHVDITVYIHIGTLFAKLTKTVLPLHMHRYLSAINRNSNGKN